MLILQISVTRISKSREKQIYDLLVRYMREVASGRRANLILGNILSFVTGSQEPVLDFEKKSSKKFLVSREYTVETNEQLAAARDDQVKLILKVNGNLVVKSALFIKHSSKIYGDKICET